MIIERTEYWARTGHADSVLETRRRANAVRLAMGLQAGTIRLGIEGGGPDVTWQCAFADRQSHTQDQEARDRSPAFAKVREEMGRHVTRFERIVERQAESVAGCGFAERDVTAFAVVPQEVTFPSDGLMLRGYLYLPPGPGPFPCMITNHGSTIEKGTTDLCRPGTAALLLSWGIASFLPHQRGYGKSPGAGWLDEVTAEFATPEYDRQLAPRLDRESDDVLAALSWLRQHPDIDAGRIGVMGSSFGGTNPLLAAAKSDGFRCAVEFAGAAINWEHTPGLRSLMLARAAELRCPIYFIQAATDYSTRPTTELAAAARKAGVETQERIFPAWGLTADEGHVFERNGPHVWGPEVRRFLERWL
jgi:carboxymethylenebutenolidase